MRLAVVSQLVTAVLAARPWLNEPDTGLQTYLDSTNYTEGARPLLKDIRGIPDFEFAARQVMTDQQYAFYRTAAAGEWAYRHNLEVWKNARLRPHQLVGVSGVNKTTGVTILGYNFSSPFFISPATRAAYGDPDRAELNFVDASANENILYVAAMYASKSIEEIAAAKHNNTPNGPQVVFQQIYSNANLSVTWDIIKRAEAANAKAIVWTIDAPGDSTRHRAARYDTTNANGVTSDLTWDLYEEMKSRTKLPIILKGIATVEDALTAVEKGVEGIWLSNHGARQVDYSPSPLEIAYEIRRNAPHVFEKTEVLADSGVRYGSDVVKLLALGVKAVGMGRPFMFSNVYGVEGPTKLIQLMKNEIIHDAAQIGISDLKNIPYKVLNTRALERDVYIMDDKN
ncbi:FMN-dependent dehydrogenase [Ilyonectria robusta]|uniref:FMN-dependent dehydrogenase n=1 Tax=Ilyonectria robusta TaxID=1079257 RepID=UPI001E8CD486|nr:FMN-dependent dehydrogenase [Ilyonectria robusta]KAH8733849.1 FMN-dependent dehydrogenase [Ilyonectria robusta]